MGRREMALRGLETHPWFCRVYKRLGASDLEAMIAWAREREALSAEEWEKAVNRMYMDRERPRRWKEIMELLTVAGSL